MAKEIHFSNPHKKDLQKGFNSSNRYQQQKDKEYQELEDELEALAKGDDEDTSNTDKSQPEKQESTSTVNWEKRYSDLRSHSAKKEAEFQSRIEAIEAKFQEAQEHLKETQESSNSIPEDEEQFNEWIKSYPTVAANMEKIVMKKLKGVEDKLNQTQDKLTQNDLRIAQQQAISSLLKKHPDWMTLKDTPEWNEWLEKRSKASRDLIHNPSSYDEDSVIAASEVIDLYKAQTGRTKTKKSSTPEDAANSVTKSKSVSPTTGNGNDTFSESQINNMSEREYAQKEEAILAAQKKGPPHFIYDMTGAAR